MKGKPAVFMRLGFERIHTRRKNPLSRVISKSFQFKDFKLYLLSFCSNIFEAEHNDTWFSGLIFYVAACKLQASQCMLFGNLVTKLIVLFSLGN